MNLKIQNIVVMAYRNMIKSLRIKLDDFISSDNEKLIMENLRRCRYFAGKEFSLILWNETLEEKDLTKRARR